MTTITTSTTPPTNRAELLIELASVAFHKAGGREQPGGDSDVTEFDGATTVTLRNVNGVLAVYEVDGDKLKRQAAVVATVDQLFKAAFAGPRDPRSAEYKAGVRAALPFRIDDTLIKRQYQPGTAQDDAFSAGLVEGYAIFRCAQACAAGAA